MALHGGQQTVNISKQGTWELPSRVARTWLCPPRSGTDCSRKPGVRQVKSLRRNLASNCGHEGVMSIITHGIKQWLAKIHIRLRSVYK